MTTPTARSTDHTTADAPDRSISRPSRRPLALATLTLTAGALAPGCVQDRNARPTLGGQLLTDTFHPAPTPIAQGPSAGLDRERWPARVFVVPVDGTVHAPVRHRDVRLTDDTARQQSLMPTLESALELEGNTGNAQALEGVIAPFAAVVDLALLPIDVALSPPWATRESPQVLYKRSTQGGWSSSPLTAPRPGAAPAAAPTRPGSWMTADQPADRASPPAGAPGTIQIEPLP